MTTREAIALLPCPFCGSDHIVLWSGYGTQADIICEECCCERNVQVADLFAIDERPKMDLKTCRFPDAAIERVNQHLISEWNTRGLPPQPRPASDYDPAMGPVLWWRFPIAEPPYVGTPDDCGMTVEVDIRHYVGGEGEVKTTSARTDVGGWPGYHTHFTPIPIPGSPVIAEPKPEPQPLAEGYELFDGKPVKVLNGDRSGWWRFHNHCDRDGYCDNPGRGY